MTHETLSTENFWGNFQANLQIGKWGLVIPLPDTKLDSTFNGYTNY